MDFESARDHFGSDAWEFSEAGCVDPLRYDEKGLRSALVQMYLEMEAARNVAEEAEIASDNYSAMQLQLERLFGGARTAHQAWLKLDFEIGRATTAEAIIAYLERKAPRLVAEAREEICRAPAS